MKLSIIIVSWNVKEDLSRCLHSLEENPPSSKYEVIVVDNGSSDGTIESIRNHFPGVHFIANSDNRGFAAANNQGIEKSQGEYVLFLNPDTIIDSNCLNILMDFMDKNEDVGVCGPKLLYGDGTVQRSVRRFPSFRGALHRHTIFKILKIFKSDYEKWVMRDFKYDRQMEVDQVMGAALMTRRSIIKTVGMMDEIFFVYYEEVDLCYRIKQAGWRIVFLPEAKITHLGGRSSGQIPADKTIMAMTSLLKFFKKHRSKFASTVFICVFKPALIITDLVDILSGFIKYIFYVIIFNSSQRQVSARKIKRAVKMLSKYSWISLFNI
jgi:GT2 family glycosyltransferase